ncbi:Retrovirus-related Pol polyprotein from transposon opus [Ceratobasidium sp. AG-Ba]|nr:Retrovirus-related Pol polyprotein from transposon opus [Ceratobasidium sp. AG-Ba]
MPPIRSTHTQQTNNALPWTIQRSSPSPGSTKRAAEIGLAVARTLGGNPSPRAKFFAAYADGSRVRRAERYRAQWKVQSAVQSCFPDLVQIKGRTDVVGSTFLHHCARQDALLLIFSTAPITKTAFQDANGRWRNSEGRFLSADAVAAILQQPTPEPSVSPAPPPTNQESSSTPPSLSSILVSLESSPTPSNIPFPPSPAPLPGLEFESDDDQLPRTPIRPRPRHSTLPTAPLTARVFCEDVDDSPRPNSPVSSKPRERSSSEDDPAASPTTVLRQPRTPSQPQPQATAVLNLAPSTPAPGGATLSIIPLGTTPPSSGSAATSVMAGVQSGLRDAMILVQKLGAFADGNSPMPEAKYRHHFKQYTFGLTDKERAQVWVNNLDYASPAHVWYRNLTNTPDKAKSVVKWPDLEKEIEKRWPTPQWDNSAHVNAMQEAWAAHWFEVTPEILAKLQDRSNMTKPHQVWAEEHRALGMSVNSTDEDRVSKTITELPSWLVHLLPKGDRYEDHFNELMKDIGALSSRQVAYAYERESVYEVLTTWMQEATITPHQPYSQPSHAGPPSTPQTRKYQQTPTSRRSTLRFSNSVQQTIIPLNDTVPSSEARALPQPPLRHIPPHMPAAPPSTPQTPSGPLPSVMSRALNLQGSQIIRPGGKVDNSPVGIADYQARRDEWHKANPGKWPSSRRPYPLSPGTFEQTLELCPRCGRENHSVLECTASGPYTLAEHERKYQESVQRRLSREAEVNRWAGTQPDTPTPAPRYQDTHQVEYSDAEMDFESVAGTSWKSEAAGSGLDDNLQMRTVQFDSFSELCTRSESNDLIYPYPEQLVIDVGSVEEETNKREWPFKMRIGLARQTGEQRNSLWGTVDGGSMLCVVDSTVWAQIEHLFGRLRQSRIVCRMANGACVPSIGTGVGFVAYQEAEWPVRFEVLDSKGAFEVLLGKDWLTSAGARQLFRTDTLSLDTPTGRITVVNANPQKPARLQGPRPLIKPIAERGKGPDPKTEPELEQNRELESPGEPVPRRSSRLRAQAEQKAAEANPFWVAESALMEVDRMVVEEVALVATEDPEVLWKRAGAEAEEQTIRSVLINELVDNPREPNRLTEVLERVKRNRAREQAAVLVQLNETLDQPERKSVHQPPIPKSDRRSDPFKPSRVREVLSKVKIGSDLDENQRRQVEGLVGEFADVFALSLSEVLPVDITEMRLDIPDDATFPKRVGQRKFSELQKQALYDMLDDLEEAKIIKRVTQDQVAAVSPINMVPKPGGAERTDIETLQRMANSECRKYGFPVKHPEVGFHKEGESRPEAQPAKWRLVQNFAAVNHVTQIRLFPMGDLAAKQQAVAGHKFISVMDLQAGFHAIPIAPESVPYTGFYVDGRGHYVYRRMPFGLTGAPTTFCEMVATAFHGLIGKIMEVWMDDMATAADDFETALVNLRTIFERCRTHKISLSATKTVLLMSEATFAGARVLDEGIATDLRKVKAILLWPEPKSVLDVMDLTRNVRTGQLDGKNAFEYKRALRETKVELSEAAKRAFVDLKTTLTTNPVLRAPAYDGRAFIVSTDGSKYGFGAVLSQRWEEKDGQGNTKEVTYPVAFASKRTSRTEERYIPFLLEFAALKFALDEFDSIIFGCPIELETDCKALANLLGNEKLNLTHERWRESVVARNIVAVRHKSRADNRACDALSRMYEGRPDDDEGPGRLEDVDPGWEAQKGLINDMYLLLDDDATAKLLDRFKDDDFFSEILMHLLFEAQDDSPVDKEVERERKRRAHKAEGYMVEEGKLWLVGGKHARAGTKVECIPHNEGFELAHSVHRAGGHFGRDMTVLALQQEFHWPRMRFHATEAVTTCPQCKSFGPRLLSALLRPITRAKPFDLIVGDYVLLPEGHGGFKTVLVLIDVYSRYLFAFASRKPGTGKFTVDALTKISELIARPKSFMADGGSHFDCEEVRNWCEGNGTHPLTTPAYAPWTNGLAEGTIKLLIGRLKKLCAPNVGEAPDAADNAASTPSAWPKHLTTAVAQLNDRTLESLGYSPRKLLTGILTPDRKADINQALMGRAIADIDINLGLTYALRDDAYANALEHAQKRKRAFDKKARVVKYAPGDLVQKYDARLDETHSTARKLAPRWSGPLRVVKKAANSYELEDLAGNPYTRAAHSRLLRPFIPQPGTTLADYTQSLQRARQADRTASAPDKPFDQAVLPQTPRMEYEAFCRDRPNHWATLAVVERHDPEEANFDPDRPLHIHALTISQERKGGWNTQNARFWDFEGNHPNILQKELRDGLGGNPARGAFNYLWKHVGEQGEEVKDLMAGDLTLERLEEVLAKGRGGKRLRQQAELEDGEEIVGSRTREEFYQAYKRLRPLDMTKSWNSIRAYAEYTYKADAGLLPAIPVDLEVPELLKMRS